MGVSCVGLVALNHRSNEKVLSQGFNEIGGD